MLLRYSIIFNLLFVTYMSVSQLDLSDTSGLLTKCEVKMAGYISQRSFLCVYMGWDGVSFEKLFLSVFISILKY